MKNYFSFLYLENTNGANRRLVGKATRNFPQLTKSTRPYRYLNFPFYKTFHALFLNYYPWQDNIAKYTEIIYMYAPLKRWQLKYAQINYALISLTIITRNLFAFVQTIYEKI